MPLEIPGRALKMLPSKPSAICKNCRRAVTVTAKAKDFGSGEIRFTCPFCGTVNKIIKRRTNFPPNRR